MLLKDGVPPDKIGTSSSSVPERSYSTLIPSPISEWSDFLNSLEKDLYFPVPTPESIKDSSSSATAAFEESYVRPCSDAVMLTCGCIMSEKLILSHLTNTLGNICPICNNPTEILAPVLALRQIMAKISAKKKQLGFSILSGSSYTAPLEPSTASTPDTFPLSPASSAYNSVNPHLTSNIDVDDLSSQFAASLSPSNTQKSSNIETDFPKSPPDARKLNLAEIFQTAAKRVVMQEQNSANADGILVKMDSLDNAGTIDTSNPSFISQSSSNEDWLQPRIPEFDNLKYMNVNISLSQFEQREKYYKKCFPNYRKQFQHTIGPRFSLPRSKTYVSSSISPDTLKFAVATEKKWSVYWTPLDYNDSPTLLSSGRSVGETLQTLAEKQHGLKSASSLTFDPQNTAATTDIPPLLTSEAEQAALTNWSHQIISLSNRYLAIAGSNGILRMYDMENQGKCVYHHKSKFNIGYMAISPNGSLIACAITGIDNKTQAEQPMIVLHWLQLGDTAPLMTRYTNSMESMEKTSGMTIQIVETVTIRIPYKDVINCLSFSWDEAFLSCGTSLTSHILIINVTNPHEPRMMLKTSRWTDKKPESEGITSIEFFPRSRLLAITSVAKNSYPMIIDTKIKSTLSESRTIPPLSMILRVEKVGWSIHRTAISPRGNAAAFLDKNGLVYLMYAPTFENIHKRILVVAEVSSAPTYKEAAAMRFSPTGHALFIIDRKGNFHVEDFAAGSPQQAGISKCRILA